MRNSWKHFNKWPSVENVQAFAAEHQTFIHVLATPNATNTDHYGKDTAHRIAAGSSHFTLYEATLTHDAIRRWSPMVAYSGCDARVLMMDHSGGDATRVVPTVL